MWIKFYQNPNRSRVNLNLRLTTFGIVGADFVGVECWRWSRKRSSIQAFQRYYQAHAFSQRLPRRILEPSDVEIQSIPMQSNPHPVYT